MLNHRLFLIVGLDIVAFVIVVIAAIWMERFEMENISLDLMQDAFASVASAGMSVNGMLVDNADMDMMSIDLTADRAVEDMVEGSNWNLIDERNGTVSDNVEGMNDVAFTDTVWDGIVENASINDDLMDNGNEVYNGSVDTSLHRDDDLINELAGMEISVPVQKVSENPREECNSVFEAASSFVNQSGTDGFDSQIANDLGDKSLTSGKQLKTNTDNEIALSRASEKVRPSSVQPSQSAASTPTPSGRRQSISPKRSRSRTTNNRRTESAAPTPAPSRRRQSVSPKRSRSRTTSNRGTNSNRQRSRLHNPRQSRSRTTNNRRTSNNRRRSRSQNPSQSLLAVNKVSLLKEKNCCDNCFRWVVSNGALEYRLKIRMCTVALSSLSKCKFANCKQATLEAAFGSYSRRVGKQNARLRLCPQCERYFADKKVRDKAQFVWPSMVWKWLSSENVLRQHGERLWVLIPLEWRSWWLQSVHLLHPVYESTTLDAPPSYFRDVTVQRSELGEAILENKAGNLQRACNKHLNSTVWCPWGESEYLHRCGSVAFDLVVNRLFGDCMVTVAGNARSDLQKVTGVLEDFLDGNYAELLHNPDWKVMPSIAFENGAPRVLTCRKHNKGSCSKYFHLPRNPSGILPSWQSDRLTPAVVRPRTLKQFKFHKYSDTYQMQEMQGQFNGVDTVQVCDHRDFASDSTILRDREEVALTGRKDLRALVGEWGQDGHLPSYVASRRLADAEKYGPSKEEMNANCRSATFMTLKDSLKLQEMNKKGRSRVISVVKNDKKESCYFIPPWPSSLVNVHPYDSHGAIFPALPKMYEKDCEVRLAFHLAAMHATVPDLWESSNNHICSASSWEGWLLAYLGRKCFDSCHAPAKNNPFRFKKIDSEKWSLPELLVRIGMREGEIADVPAGNDGQGQLTSQNNNNGQGNDDENSESSSVSSIGWNRERDNDSTGWNIDSEDDESDAFDDLSSMGWGSSNRGDKPVLHTDGMFHVEDLEVLFHHHNDVLVGKIQHLPALMASVEDITKCVVVYHSVDAPASNIQLPSQLTCHEGRSWELRFVAGCDTKDTDSRYVLARHGGIFPRWWKQSYSKKSRYDYDRQRLQEDDISQHCPNWEVAVYVRVRSVPLEECRNAILESMGSQICMICEEHDIPLITAPHATELPCCRRGSDSTICSKSISWRCPVKDCKSAVCKKHGENIVERKEKVSIRVQENEVIVEDAPTPTVQRNADNVTWQQNTDNVNSFAMNEIEDDISVDLDDGFFASILDELSLQREEDDDDSVFSESNLVAGLSSDRRDNFVTDIMFDENIPFQDSDPDVEPFGETDVPITWSEEEPLVVRGDPSSISGCCILNNFGSLLARKGTKLRGSMNQKFFLQRIVATTPGRIVPLVYPEAMLFPSLFWREATDEGAILGAVPCGLLAHDSTLNKYGVASLQSHFYNRLTNPTLGTGCDPRYICYAFDSMVNLGCRHEDVRVVLHRGVTGTKTGVRIADSGTGNIVDKSFFDTDSVDSRPTVNKLAAAVGEKQATYFYTHTCNALEHFGVKQIRDWIEGDRVMKILCNGDESYQEREEIRRSLRQAASVPLLRNWIEVSILYMEYIEKSSEKPLGDVEHIWWRFEFQDSVGNLPHIHALIWLKEGESVDVTQQRICGSIMELIRPDEIDDLIAEGLLSCAEEILEVKELAHRVLVHVCSSRCKRRTGIGDEDLRCRVGDNEFESPSPREHCMGTIHVHHSDAACKVFEEVGLFVLNETTQMLEPVVDELVATKHYPPSHNSEGIISPCNSRLFVMTRSNDNLKYVTGYLASRYLAKYLALIDENNRVYIGSVSKERNAVSLEEVTLHNTKVAGSAIQEAKKDMARRDKKKPTGRAVSHMEMLCVLLEYEQVYTNLKFVHIPTVPLEERPAFDRKQPFRRLVDEGVVPQGRRYRRPQDLDAGNVIASFKVRNIERDETLPLWRQLSSVESLVLRDQCLAVHTVDAITLFSIRPPELRFVRQPKLYFRWFHRTLTMKKRTFEDALKLQRAATQPKLFASPWIDGSDYRIFVRPSAVKEIVQYLLYGDPFTKGARTHESFYTTDMEEDGIVPAVNQCRPSLATTAQYPAERPYAETITLFQYLAKYVDNPPRLSTSEFSLLYDEWMENKARFIGPAEIDENAKTPIIWFNSVKPIQPGRWLIHLLLSMGEFDCEMNLLGCGDMVANFVRARLIREDNTVMDEDIKALISRYIRRQLIHLPGGKEQFDRQSVAAYQILQQSLTGNGLPQAEMPATLYTHIQEQHDKKTENHILSLRTSLATTTLRDLGKANMMAEDLPPLNSVINATRASPFKWTVDLVRTEGQSEESYQEQLAAVDMMKEQLTKLQFNVSAQTKSVLFVGGPGTGKTTCLQASALEAMCRGLNTNLSALMAERAKQLGSIHLSNFFLIPVNERATPGRLAELAIARLLRNPKQLAIVKMLDVFVLDELGQVSAELLAVMDIILRRIRNSTDFMGGVLIIATLDGCQLRPVNGKPPLLSAHMLTNFRFTPLDHSVRACKDAKLRRIIEITRLSKRKRNIDVRNEFIHLIVTRCTHVKDWDDPRIPVDALRMFSTHEARKDSIKLLLTKMKKEHRGKILSRRSIDFESSTESNWIDASSATTRLLNRHSCVKEPQFLFFYPGALYEITYNHGDQFSQSQLAILAELPTSEMVKNFEPVSVYVAPEGTKSIPSHLTTGAQLLEHGFRKRSVGTAPERAKDLCCGLLGKRRQYGLNHRFAATIHAGMGQDLSAVVSKVTGDKKYHLFEREQAVVLLSRTHYAKDIYFVGDDPEATAEALAKALEIEGPYTEYMSYLIEKLVHHSSIRGPYVDLTAHHPYCPYKVTIPDGEDGYAYLMVSLAKGAAGHVTYIGECQSLVARTNNHKIGAGPTATADSGLQQWALLAYVVGFCSHDRDPRLSFERLWEAARDRSNLRRRRQNQSPLTADEIVDLGHELVESQIYRRNPNLTNLDLAFVRCGRFSPT